MKRYGRKGKGDGKRERETRSKMGTIGPGCSWDHVENSHKEIVAELFVGTWSFIAIEVTASYQGLQYPMRTYVMYTGSCWVVSFRYDFCWWSRHTANPPWNAQVDFGRIFSFGSIKTSTAMFVCLIVFVKPPHHFCLFICKTTTRPLVNLAAVAVRNA